MKTFTEEQLRKQELLTIDGVTYFGVPLKPNGRANLLETIEKEANKAVNDFINDDYLIAEKLNLLKTEIKNHLASFVVRWNSDIEPLLIKVQDNRVHKANKLKHQLADAAQKAYPNSREDQLESVSTLKDDPILQYTDKELNTYIDKKKKLSELQIQFKRDLQEYVDVLKRDSWFSFDISYKLSKLEREHGVKGDRSLNPKEMVFALDELISVEYTDKNVSYVQLKSRGGASKLRNILFNEQRNYLIEKNYYLIKKG